MNELTLGARHENIEVVTEFVNELLDAAGCPVKMRMQIDIAIDEIFSNIANYAYGPGGGDATVQVDTESVPGTVSISFIDGGIPYDPLGAEVPDTGLSADERGIGGLGILIVKKIMDDVRYAYRDGKNILTIVKKI